MLLPAPGPPLGSLRRPRAGRVTLGCVVHREALSFPPMGATFLPKANMTEEDCPGIIKICGFGMKGSYWYFIPRLNLLSQLILTALDHLNWENGTGKKIVCGTVCLRRMPRCPCHMLSSQEVQRDCSTRPQSWPWQKDGRGTSEHCGGWLVVRDPGLRAEE